MHPSILRASRALVALSILAAACSSDSSTGPRPTTGNGSPVGSYALWFSDGDVVPCVYDQGSVSGGTIKVSWVSGLATFNADSTFSITLTSRRTGPGQSGLPQSSSWTGKWRLAPGEVVLTASSGTAHWATTDSYHTLSVTGTYTKVSGGTGIALLKFGKKK